MSGTSLTMNPPDGTRQLLSLSPVQQSQEGQVRIPKQIFKIYHYLSLQRDRMTNTLQSQTYSTGLFLSSFSFCYLHQNERALLAQERF